MNGHANGKRTFVRLVGGGVVAAAALTPSPLVLPVILLGLVALFSAALSHRVVSSSVLVPTGFVVVAMFAVVSVVWSREPMETITVSLELLGVVAAAVLLHAMLGRDESLDLVGDALAFLLLVSLAAVVVAPGTAFTSEEHERGALQGIFVHRNSLAYVALLTFVLKAVAPMRGSIRTRVSWGVLAAFVIVMTSSRTAWVVAFAPILVALLLRNGGHSRWLRSRRMVPVVVLLAVTAFFMVGRLEEVTEALDRDVTLTGRTLIWGAVVDEIHEHPLLGVGWGGVWRSENDVTLELRLRTGFDEFHAHNGYLDVLLQGGLVGFALYGAALAGIARGVGRASRLNDDRMVLWCACVGSTMLLYDLFDTNIVNPLPVLIFALGVLAVARPLRPGPGSELVVLKQGMR